ncbi:hypothetical protein T484DRAFT_1770428 [Baffinella frigidus]|nr:hypothetical protein T484DRAFT_1770428 [Cryptophyta sp. CCMP2293]
MGLIRFPTAEEAWRLVKAGLEMQAAVRHYAAKRGLAIYLRVGLHCGEATGAEMPELSLPCA